MIDGAAYVSTFGGVWKVPAGDQPSFAAITHPTLGEPYRVTRTVKGPDGRLYAGANFGTATTSEGDLFIDNAALYALDEPDTPQVFWAGRHMVIGLDSQLRGLGNIDVSSGPQCCEPLAAEFLSDGTVSFLSGPVPQIPSGDISATTSSGYAVGSGGTPGMLGIRSALWTPDGSFSFIDESIPFADTVRDRADGQGVNISLGNFVKFGDQDPLLVNSMQLMQHANAIVSQSDFVVTDGTFKGYFPGIVPGMPGLAVPLVEIFPELVGVDFQHITDITAVDGHIFLTYVADNQLFLFGARDPSIIPEPRALLLTIPAGLFAMSRRMRFRAPRGH